MKRWMNKRPLRKIKSSATALFVIGVVAFPIVLTGWQWGRIIRGDTSRQATPLPALTVRSADKSSTPKLFDEPLISITFDDGWESIYTTAMPTLNRYGIHSTQYILTGTETFPGYMSWAQIDAISHSGHEIACHTVDHPDLTTLSDEEISKQLYGCKEDLGKRYGNISDFASPYGSYNAHTIGEIKKVYGSQRNINGVISDGISDIDVNLKTNFDRYNIIGVTVRRDTTVAELEQLVNYAAERNAWLVLVYHQADDGPSQYGIDPHAMDKQLKYISDTPYKIVTIGQVIKTLREGDN